MATTLAASHPPSRGGAEAAVRAEDCVPDQVRVLRGATRWYAAPVCAMISHRWASASWSRWAFGWDREVTCKRCGQIRHERAKLHADLPYEDDR